MRRIASSDVRSAVLASLGLASGLFDLESPEAMAALVRRAASMLCPCPPRLLVNEIRGALHGLASVTGDEIEAALEAVVAHGDLWELRDRSPDSARASTRLVYVAAPAYVARGSGNALLLGLAPDGTPTLPPHLERQIEHEGHIRRLPMLEAEDRSLLQELGVRELTFDEWSGVPARRSAEEHMAVLEALLEEAPPSGEVQGLRVLDPSQPVRFYRGRWTETGRLSSRLVGRRPQAYGADLWCFVELVAGEAKRFIDFPVEEESHRACDEAWRLQAAIDATRGDPQRYRLRMSGPDGKVAIDLFSPVPEWARRRWDAVGSPLAPKRCLFSYEFSSAELEEELRFLHEDLWLAQFPDEE